MKIKLLITFMVILFSYSLFCDEVEKKNPTKATLLSLAIPGGGQFYNEAYVKSGIFFLSETYFITKAISHHKEMNKYTEFSDSYEKYYNKRQNMIWWTGITVALSMLDAYVDAHLSDYDSKKNDIDIIFENEKLILSYKF